MNRPSKVAGIDVSRGSITVAILDDLPQQRLKDFIKKCRVQKFKSTEVEQLLALDFDAAVLEPTGGHYSRFWAWKIEASGRLVRWVGHREVHGYRESWRLPDKTDKTDAVALACYGLERWNMPGMFLETRSEVAAQLRELYLQIQFLNRATTPLINRLRQQLHWECPELAEHKANRDWLAKPLGIWQAVAGEPSAKWQQVITNSQGFGISKFSQGIAAQIVAQQQQILDIELELEQLLLSNELKPYLEAMRPFHFGRRATVAMLSAFYPLEKDRTLGAFKLSCGMAQVWVESGDFKGWVPGGSKDIRRSLWLWAFIIIPKQPGCRGYVTSPELEALRDYYWNGCDQLVVNKQKEAELKHFDPGKGNQRLMRTARRALTMLYRKLKAQ